MNRTKEVIQIYLNVRIVGRLSTLERITRNVITITALIADRILRTVKRMNRFDRIIEDWIIPICVVAGIVLLMLLCSGKI